MRRLFQSSNRTGLALLAFALVAVAAIIGLAHGCRHQAPPPGPRAGAADTEDGSPAAESGSRGYPRVRMRNVHLLIDPDVVLEVRELSGRLEPMREGEVPFFDDPKSFRIDIDGATTAISTASMTALLNRYTFAGPDSPLSGLEVGIHEGKLTQKGTMHKGVDLPFEMEGELSVTPDGLLRVHPTKIKVAHLPVRKLLDALGVELAEVVKMRGNRAVSFVEDDLLLDPNHLLPPPAISGKVGAVHLEGDRIVLEFAGSRRNLKPSLPEARNYMYFRGGRLRFGKLTMQDTDLQIVDSDPDDPFRFFLEQYDRQLVAGYSKTMPDLGLVAYMPDTDEVR